MSVLHHVCNQHEWVDGRCAHKEIADDSRRDKDFQALQEVGLAPRLLASLKYCVHFIYLSWFWRVALSYRPFRERMDDVCFWVSSILV